MKTFDLSEQIRILQILANHVQSSFKFQALDLRVYTKTASGKILIELVPKAEDLAPDFTMLMHGLGYLRDFGLMTYNAEDWEKGIEAAMLILKNTEVSVDFSTGKVSFKLPSNAEQYHAKLREFLKEQLEYKTMKFCSIEKLWRIAWVFTEKELALKTVTVSSDRVFQFEIDDDSEEAERLMEECLKGLEFLAKVPEEV